MTEIQVRQIGLPGSGTDQTSILTDSEASPNHLMLFLTNRMKRIGSAPRRVFLMATLVCAVINLGPEFASAQSPKSSQAPLMSQTPEMSRASFITKDGHVEFRSSVPLHSFSGKSDLLNGRISLADSTVDFFVDLSTIKTGNGKRDKDMRRTLNTKEYPFAEFFGKLTTAFDPSVKTEQVVSVSGAFSIHGITRNLEVAGTLRIDGENLLLSATWEISNEEYEIVPPKLLIMKVDDIQTVSISASLKRENP